MGATRDGGEGADGKIIIERLFIYLSFVETFNSKVIKGFVPELRSRYVFFVFRDSYVQCIYVIIILCTFRHHHHHHHVVLVARISLTLSHHFSLSFIASGRSSGQHPVSSHSFWMYVRAGHPAFARPCVGSIRVHHLWVRPCFSSSVLHVWFV